MVIIELYLYNSMIQSFFSMYDVKNQ